ncbi:MAG: AzlC family ABC transporter permease [Acidobacteriota bacterium]|nr:AzlC family ABC transporter permease [Acidobacteriota bacterium]MDE3044688.1 AzlC family ABC transporter permease [Acidobacteriota bacterium]MDE3222924.1 AzlC family ABC transporter permease [Acidobacteriota bacterium]
MVGATRRDALSVGITVGAYGVAFGAAGVVAGFSVLQTCLFSLITFSGASQFAAVGVIGAGGGPWGAIGAAALLGTRNALYGVQMAPLLEQRSWRKVLAAHVTIDESTGVALAQESRGLAATREGFWWTGLSVYLFWNLFTLAGALGARSLGSPASWGLDAAVPAAFLGLVWPRLTTPRRRAAAGASMVLCLVLTPVVPAGLGVIATVVVAIVLGWRA